MLYLLQGTCYTAYRQTHLPWYFLQIYTEFILERDTLSICTYLERWHVVFERFAHSCIQFN